MGKKRWKPGQGYMPTFPSIELPRVVIPPLYVQTLGRGIRGGGRNAGKTAAILEYADLPPIEPLGAGVSRTLSRGGRPVRYTRGG
jgi:hypothetical protein